METTAFSYFKTNLRLGLWYALWLVLVGAACGAAYGILAGIVIEPAVFCVLFCGVIAIMNLFVAILVFGVNLLLRLLGKGNRRVIRYFALSLSIGFTYLLVFYLVYLSGLNIF